MSKYFQCGVFRVHAPVRILNTEMAERRYERERAVKSLMHTAESIAKTKDKSGKFIETDIILPVTKSASLYIYTRNGKYDIFLQDSIYGRRVDIVPSELNKIINNIDILKQRLDMAKSYGERGLTIAYASPTMKEDYYKSNSPDVNPVRGSPYNPQKYDEYERE